MTPELKCILDAAAREAGYHIPSDGYGQIRPVVEAALLALRETHDDRAFQAVIDAILS